MAAPSWPFLGTEALAARTVTDHRLRSSYVAVHRNVYVPRRPSPPGCSPGAAPSSPDCRLPRCTAPAGLTRSFPQSSIGQGATRSKESSCTATPARTAFDIGRRRGLEVAVIRLDALMQATRLKTPDIDLLVDRHAGARGIIQLRKAISLADAGTESPQETRTRLLLVAAGGTSSHAWTWVGDSTRWASNTTVPSTGPTPTNGVVTSTGSPSSTLRWTIVRVSSEMLRYRPTTVVARTRSALRERGLLVDKIA